MNGPNDPYSPPSTNPFTPTTMDAQAPSPSLPQKPNVPVSAHLACGWPLLLVAIGGAIGGGLGGAAYALNLAIYKSKLPLPAKIVLNIFSGFAAIALWLAIAVFIQLMRS